MLGTIRISNFALIENLEITLRDGLTVISGETGAGKSIIVQAMAGLTGTTLSSDIIPDHSDKAVIEGSFNTSGQVSIEAILSQNGLEISDTGDLCLRIEINRKSRNRYLINDQAVTRQIYQSIGQNLIDMNSQHEHQLLLQEKYHLDILDEALELAEHRLKVSRKLDEITGIRAELSDKMEKARKAEAERLVIMDRMSEIDAGKLVPGEKEELVQEMVLLRHFEQINRHLERVLESIQGKGSDLISEVSQIEKHLLKACEFDSSLKDSAESAGSASLMLAEIRIQVEGRLRKNVDPSVRLNEIAERLHFIQQMEGKYHNDVDGILAHRMQLDRDLSSLQSLDAEIQILSSRMTDAFNDYMILAESLSERRRQSSRPLCNRIVGELKHLGMESARFDIGIEKTDVSGLSETGAIPDGCLPSGIDRISFRMSANPGIPLKPISQVASGGELSRIMLALKQHLLSRSSASTVVFDEIDAGIGGQTAMAVGHQIRRISKTRQVLCVTHLPQIAAFADSQILVEKEQSHDRTMISAREVKHQDRIGELARMLSGMRSRSALEHARVLLNKAKQGDTPELWEASDLTVDREIGDID